MSDPARQSSELAHAIAAGMPACPNCAGRNVRPSQPVRLEDKIMALLRYTPFRCRTCQNRFFKRQKHSETPADAPTDKPAAS